MSADSGKGRPGLRLHPGAYAVCRLPPGSAVDEPDGGFFSLTRTAAETSVVCREEEAPAGAEVESGWRLLEVAGPLDFSQIGVLAGLATPLAQAAVSIFVLSTFDTDYLLIKDAQWPAARRALEVSGHRLEAAPSS